VGGPIVRDKTFFFVNYDGQRTRNSLPQKYNVPTVAERTGDLTGLGSSNFNNDPNFRINAAAQALLNKVPLPTPGLAGPLNLLAIGEQSIDTNQYNARADDQLSIKDSAFAAPRSSCQ